MLAGTLARRASIGFGCGATMVVLAGLCPPQDQFWDRKYREISHAAMWEPTFPQRPPEDPMSPPGDPGEVGQWLPSQDWEVIAIHAALLPNGKVLHYAYPSGGSMTWDPVTGEFEEANVNSDLFCSGLSHMPDGTLLVTGGNDDECQFQGRMDVHLFDPVTGTWLQQDDMADGRWYPTNVVLGNGETLVFTGLDRTCVTNPDIELYTPGVGMEVIGQRGMPLYPNMHLLSDGRVAHVGPDANTYTFNPQTRLWTFIDRTNRGQWRGAAPSVLLPGRTDQIMIMGGSSGGVVTNTAEIIDFSGETPVWRNTAPMHHARAHFDALILPDETVFIMGGGVTDLYDNPIFVPELFDPESEEWIDLPMHEFGRMYHSTTVLLPDGRVLIAGQDRGPSARKGEIYMPRYLFRGARPAIDAAPEEARYGGTISIESDEADDIEAVFLIAPTANTHSINMTQRFVDLSFRVDGENTLVADIPSDPNLAPPGYYMLFIRNTNDVPSVAAWLKVGPIAPAELTGVTMLDGFIVSGGVEELSESDDGYLETEAEVTGEVAQPHLMRMRIAASSPGPGPSTLTLTTEGKISDIEATTWLSLRDWVNGGYVEVDQFTMGQNEISRETTVTTASRFLRASDGRLRLQVKQIVFFPFTLGGFHTMLDHVKIVVEN